jgi:transposase
MVKYTIRGIQSKIVKKMDQLCNPLYGINMSISKAAEAIGISPHIDNTSPKPWYAYKISKRQVIRYYTYYLTYGKLYADKKNSKHKDRLINHFTWLKIKAIIDNDPTLYLDEISAKLYDQTGSKISGNVISKRMKVEGYSRKVIYAKAVQQNKRDKEQFINTMRFHITKPEMALFIDESNKDRTAAIRKFGYGAVGKQLNRKTVFNRDIRYTFLGAANMYGFVFSACDVVPHFYKEKEDHQPVDTERFYRYMQTHVAPILGNYLRQESNSVVIMDNCSIHIDGRITKLIEDAGAIIIYSAPYCPEIIPIEYMFSQWKAYLKRYRIDYETNWEEMHQFSLLSITPEQGMEYFKKTTLVELIDNHPNGKKCREQEAEDLEVANAIILINMVRIKYRES